MTRIFTFWLLAISLVLVPAQSGLTAESEELKAVLKEIGALKEAQAALQKQINEIKLSLQARSPSAAPENVVVSVEGAPFKGDRKAKVTLIEFSDYQCPYCGRHFRETQPKLLSDYVQTGKVKYIFRNFPLESIHPYAFKAAEAAGCAADQGKFWEMHDRLFENQNTLGPKDLVENARTLGLDLPKFQKCLESGKNAPQIRNDIADGEKAGMNGTPSFFLGITDPKEPKVKALKTLKGAQPYSSFKEAIDGLLASQK